MGFDPLSQAWQIISKVCSIAEQYWIILVVACAAFMLVALLFLIKYILTG